MKEFDETIRRKYVLKMRHGLNMFGVCRKDSEAQREEQARQRHEEAHNQNQQNVILSKYVQGSLVLLSCLLAMPRLKRRRAYLEKHRRKSQG